MGLKETNIFVLGKIRLRNYSDSDNGMGILLENQGTFTQNIIKFHMSRLLDQCAR